MSVTTDAGGYTAHLDTFTRDHLPPADRQPQFLFDRPELQFAQRLNCAVELLDKAVAEGDGDRTCLLAPGGVRWTYADLLDRANRVAEVLSGPMGLVPGNRVLLRGPNCPMMVACWFGVVKAGGVAVATMPLLRAKELGQILGKAEVTHALVHQAMRDELDQAAVQHPRLQQVLTFSSSGVAAKVATEVATDADASDARWGADTLEAAMADVTGRFSNVDTALTDTCILAFTSGTTGQPKATMHFHRDVMAACACWPRSVLRAQRDDVFIGSPPLAFTFGLGGLVLFPMSVRATAALLEKAMPTVMAEAVRDFGATVLFTAPTSYRVMAETFRQMKLSAPLGGTLRKCVSAGEALPAATRALWRDATGIEMIDGIGSTELLHIFISADEHEARPGATGKAVPGYQACILDDQGQPVGPGVVGHLAVRGPTGCRYLDDPRQANYVKWGWNVTGDAYLMDDDGFFHYQARTDDMIISAGYNIGSPEVEDALMSHPAVAECGVVGLADEERGQVVSAFVVLKPGFTGDAAMTKTLQDHVKQAIAPYKYPRRIEYRDALPRTETGKLQRFRLRQS